MHRTKQAFELVRDALEEIDGRLGRVKQDVDSGIDEIHSLVMGLQVALSQFHADQKARHTTLEHELLAQRERIEALEAASARGAHKPA